MRKFLSIILVMCLLLVPSTSALAASNDSTKEIPSDSKMINLIASGDDYLVGGGVEFESFPSDVPVVQWESGGKNHTHQYLTARALTILQADKGRKVATLLTKYSSTILANSDWPDSSENDFPTYAGHFYDPRTGLNWLGSSSPTALSRFLYHSQRAKSYYATNKTASMQELGRALHYLADINEPHHAANLTALNSNHTAFEKYADTNRANYTVNSSPYYADYTTVDAKTDYNGYCTQVINNSANHALDYVSGAASSVTASNNAAAEATMEYSQQVMAAYLYNFLRSVGATT